MRLVAAVIVAFLVLCAGARADQWPSVGERNTLYALDAALYVASYEDQHNATRAANLGPFPCATDRSQTCYFKEQTGPIAHLIADSGKARMARLATLGLVTLSESALCFRSHAAIRGCQVLVFGGTLLEALLAHNGSVIVKAHFGSK